ncbi:MAG: hypothetical protein QM621_10300 [Aeromicrobium sp.]|uniref:nucleotide exchange factor GrpE n=1 Tax=Aeromicrobium sp. TaxID=1871063 RepID=UPI0039E24FD3
MSQGDDFYDQEDEGLHRPVVKPMVPPPPQSAGQRSVPPSRPDPGDPDGDDATGTSDGTVILEDGLLDEETSERESRPDQVEVDQPAAASSFVESEAFMELSDTVRSLQETVDGFGAQVGRFHTRAERYEENIRTAQSRIEKLQGDQVRELLKPVITKLAGLHELARQAGEDARVREEARSERDFADFVHQLEQALDDLDIESVGATVNLEVNPRQHHVVQKVATEDPTLDRRIQKVIRQGFAYIGAERVLLPARVRAYVYEPPVVGATDTPPTEGV